MTLEAPVLRIGDASDAVTVSALATHVYLDTYGPTGITPELAREAFVMCSPQACTELLSSPQLHFVLAERGNRLLAMLEMNKFPAKPPGFEWAGLEISRLYVQPAAQGQRIGTTLLSRADSYALESGVALVWLTAWAGNHRALRFYAARGFRDVGATPYVFEGRSYENRVLVKPLVAGAV